MSKLPNTTLVQANVTTITDSEVKSQNSLHLNGTHFGEWQQGREINRSWLDSTINSITSVSVQLICGFRPEHQQTRRWHVWITRTFCFVHKRKSDILFHLNKWFTNLWASVSCLSLELMINNCKNLGAFVSLRPSRAFTQCVITSALSSASTWASLSGPIHHTPDPWGAYLGHGGDSPEVRWTLSLVHQNLSHSSDSRRLNQAEAVEELAALAVVLSSSGYLFQK